MSYLIKDVAKMMNVKPSTLRYYDKEGLLPGIKRKNGIRVFEEEDFKWLWVLNCLKNTNMPIKKIREYVELSKQGDASLEKRYALIKEQKQNILKQIEEFKYYLKEVNYKEWYYETALRLGSEAKVKAIVSDNATMELDKIPKEEIK